LRERASPKKTGVQVDAADCLPFPPRPCAILPRTVIFNADREARSGKKRANGQFLILLLPTINEDSERGRMITTSKQEGISPKQINGDEQDGKKEERVGCDSRMRLINSYLTEAAVSLPVTT